MTTAVQHRRGTTAEHSTFTGLEGEVTIDTTKDTAVIHDGVLAGGYPLAKENLANVTTSGLASIDGASTASDDKFFIYDQSATTLKTITRAELNNAIEQDALANVAITGGTINGTAIGGTTAAAGAFSTLSASGAVTLSGGTANSIPYLNGSKVLTTGSALTFDGTNFTTTGKIGAGGSPGLFTQMWSTGNIMAVDGSQIGFLANSGAAPTNYMTGSSASNFLAWVANNSEQMRLTSTGLGIGTSSPASKLHVESTTGNQLRIAYNSSFYWKIERDPSTGALKFSDVSTERLNLDQYGNLGLGVTPSAWGAGSQAMQNGGGAVFQYNNDRIFIGQNNYIDASFGDKYIANGYATRYRQYAGTHAWYTAPSGTAGNAITFTQAMTLDASGNLGLNTPSPVALNSGGGYFTVNNASSGGGVVFQNNAANIAYAIADTDGLRLDTFTGKILKFGIQGSERARIDSSGNLLVGTTTSGRTDTNGTAIDPTGIVYQNHINGTASGSFYTRFSYAATQIGSISQSGTTAVAYNTSSDYRLKEDVQPMTGALAKVAALKPCTYKWKADGSDGEGFIAHELAEVVPGCVTGEKDAVDAEGKPVYQGIDTSFLAGLYAAALQELMAEVNSLKAEIAALKA